MLFEKLFFPTKKQPLYAYLTSRDVWMLTFNNKRLTKKQRISLKRKVRQAKKDKALDDAYIDREACDNES